MLTMNKGVRNLDTANIFLELRFHWYCSLCLCGTSLKTVQLSKGKTLCIKVTAVYLRCQSVIYGSTSCIVI